MSTLLAPLVLDRRFQDFIELGRARLRPLAPEWTDHNAHDPGITLVELLAWVAEAQMYAAGHVRRDERAAFASLLGLEPRGTRASSGCIWPDVADPTSPSRTFSKNVVIGDDSAISVAGDEALTFRVERPILWTPGRISRLEARQARQSRIDLTSINERGATPFLPFGDSAGRGSACALTFQVRDDAGLFGADPGVARAAAWVIGVHAAPSLSPARSVDGTAEAGAQPRPPSPLSATLVAGHERYPVTIVADSSRGMLTTGAIALDLSTVPGSPREFTIELTARRGLPRPPRVLRIEANVLPIRQGRAIRDELHVAGGSLGWHLDLRAPGLQFEAGAEPVTLQVSEGAGLQTWTRTGALADCGPDDRVFELDLRTGRITFGNGINGRIPPQVTQVLVSYAVSDGGAGNLGRNRKWRVAGFRGVFGVNVEPIDGGAAATGPNDQRRDARRRSTEEHALVSPADICAAALAVPLLDVARCWVASPNARLPRTGEVHLIAMRARPMGHESERVLETPRWLEAVRRRLVERIPLGTRLIVRAPRYVDMTIRAEIDAEPGREPSVVESEVTRALRERLAGVELKAGHQPRDPGDPVTRRDVASWIRQVAGVGRIVSLELRRGGGPETRVDVPADGLPRWREHTSRVHVSRTATGERP